MGRIKISILIRLLFYCWKVKRKGWWYRFPFLPMPPKAWLLWRMETAWGIDSTNPQWSEFPSFYDILTDIYNFGSFLKNVGRSVKR